MNTSQPFSQLRVLDLSTEIAGAYATKLLGDLGAQVLKVEDPARPDPLRRRTAARVELPEGEDSALFRFLHAGKRGAVSEHPGELRALADEADIVFESQSDSEGPESLARRLGTLAELRARSPKLVVVSISPWGRSGPWADRPATEWTLQAATGFMARRGTPERGPVGAGGRLGEYAAGAFAAVTALAAARRARTSGAGAHIDVSMFEAMLICGTQYFDLDGQFGAPLLRQVLDTPAIEPAADGWIGFAMPISQQWQDFCLMIERPEIALDERMRTANDRMEHIEFIREAVHAWTKPRTVETILEQCELRRIPSAPIGNGETLLQMDHFAERGVFVENPHGFLQPRVPASFSEIARGPIGRAPALGEHALRWQDRERDAGRGDRDRTQDSAGSEGGAGGALDGLRVVDLTAFWAGPFTTHVLGSLGADVVKIESIQRPDGMRFVNCKAGVPIWEGGSIFHGANTQKRAITLQLDSDEGRALLRRLIEGADLLVENFSARVLANFGLDQETLHRWNPRLILLRMPAWGLDGPWRDRTGFAMNVEQACGIAWRAGYDDQPMTANFCDPLGGLHAVVALFAALDHRAATGQGQLIELPLAEPGINVAAEQVVEHSAYGVRLEPEGNRGPDHAPQGIYRCGDGEWIALSVRSDEEWSALGAALRSLGPGTPPTPDTLFDVLDDPSLASVAERHARHDEIDSELERALSALDAAAAAERLCEAGIPAQQLINGHRLMPNPQLEHRHFFQHLGHPHTGTSRYPGLPVVGLADGMPTTAPPTLGQHNDEILAGELGISEDELADLAEKRVIGTRPAWEG